MVKNEVEFNIGQVKIENERYDNWKVAWRKPKNVLKEGHCKIKIESFKEKKLESDIPAGFEKEGYGWPKCNTDARKTASIFNLQEQMVETRAWKKMRGSTDQDNRRLRGECKETVQHLLAGCKM